MDKIIIHEDFKDSAYDIALLKLGKANCLLFSRQFTENRVDLSVFRPVCLPEIGESFVGQEGHVYGNQYVIALFDTALFKKMNILFE